MVVLPKLSIVAVDETEPRSDLRGVNLGGGIGDLNILILCMR